MMSVGNRKYYWVSVWLSCAAKESTWKPEIFLLTPYRHYLSFQWATHSVKCSLIYIKLSVIANIGLPSQLIMFLVQTTLGGVTPNHISAKSNLTNSQ